MQNIEFAKNQSSEILLSHRMKGIVANLAQGDLTFTCNKSGVEVNGVESGKVVVIWLWNRMTWHRGNITIKPKSKPT